VRCSKRSSLFAALVGWHSSEAEGRPKWANTTLEQTLGVGSPEGFIALI
jgi:hypothetical protein